MSPSGELLLERLGLHPSIQVTTHLGVVRKDCTTSSAPCTDGTVSVII